MTELTDKNDQIVESIIDEEMKKSYLAYAMSVLVGRALPDVNDGLKPVHRRILYAMRDLGLTYNKQTRKSARIVGDVIGKYHPHGDTAVYESMVRLAQPFSLRYPLVHGQGNFGSIDGDRAAAMRYTEAKMTKLAEAMLEDIEKETVDFAPNFDEMEQEPKVLPSKLPNLLLNGSTGIAVGMATNMAPHNLTEVSDALVQVIDNPEIEDAALLESVSAPDFPTGGVIVGKSGVRSAYMHGRGRVILRARTHVEEGARKTSIIITEIPYMVKKEDLLVNMAECKKNKVIPDISEIRDESDKEGLRIVVELKQGAQKELVLNQLFKHTRLQGTFGIINLCLVNGIPKILTLKELLTEFLGHRERVVVRRIQFLLKKAEEKAHLLLGLKKAVENLDSALKIIRGSQEAKVARSGLMESFGLDEKQAQAILDMRLQKLTGLEREGIVKEYNDIMLSIAEYKGILADRSKVVAIIRQEVLDIREQFGDARRTDIIDAEFDFDQEDLIEDGTAVITITQNGFVKRVPVDTYRAQARGGKGIIGASTRQEDEVKDIFTAQTKAHILCFSNTGQMYWLKTYRIPEAGRTASGRSIRNLLPLSDGEEITAFIPVNMFDEGLYLVMATKNGVIKKVPLPAFAKPRTSGIRALQLDDGDELIGARISDGSKEIILATAHGLAARFSEENVRAMGRTAFGVRGIKLQDGDSVIGMILDNGDGTILTVTENGYGKRTPVSDYRLINRGGKGVINIQTSDRNGNVVHIASVTDEDNILLMSQSGIVIRTRADQISVIGRNTQGVRLMRLGEGDIVTSVAKVLHEEGVDVEESE